MSKPKHIVVCTWRQVTLNHHVAQITANASIEVRRPRSYQRLGMAKPWYVILFGSPHTGLPHFATPTEAIAAAEKAAESEIREMAKKIGAAQ